MKSPTRFFVSQETFLYSDICKTARQVALLLQLSEPVSDAFPFGRFWRSSFFLDPSFPLGKAAVILFNNGFGFSVGYVQNGKQELLKM